MTTGYNQLQEAWKANLQSFGQYELDCRAFVNRLRIQLAEYLGCESDKIELVQLSENAEPFPFLGKEQVELSQGRGMVLYKDAFYGFALKIVLDPPNGLVTVFQVKKRGKEYIVQLGDNAPRTIPENEPQQLRDYAEYVAHETEQYLRTGFENFIRGQERLGFRIADSQRGN
jgi:hypothetical protein